MAKFALGEAVEGSLKEIEVGLQRVQARREKLLKESRDAISHCSKAIVMMHTGNTNGARQEIHAARDVIESLRKEGTGGSLSRYLIPPETEYVEAVAVQAIASGEPIPGFATLGVSSESYLMGLLDTIGEVKRLLLDAVMQAKISKAREYFALMEEMHSALSPFAIFDNAVGGGLRRKIDVGRSLTEDARGIMAEEARRASLIDAMGKLQGRAAKTRRAPS